VVKRHVRGFVVMSQTAEFVEAPGEGFGGGESGIELVPAFLADWLGRETEGFESQLAPEVLVQGDFAEEDARGTKVEDICTAEVRIAGRRGD
jgi:hypothetical protein